MLKNPVRVMFPQRSLRLAGISYPNSCAECGATVNPEAQYRHWNWHQRLQNRRYQIGLLYETVNILWGKSDETYR